MYTSCVGGWVGGGGVGRRALWLGGSSQQRFQQPMGRRDGALQARLQPRCSRLPQPPWRRPHLDACQHRQRGPARQRAAQQQEGKGMEVPAGGRGVWREWMRESGLQQDGLQYGTYAPAAHKTATAGAAGASQRRGGAGPARAGARPYSYTVMPLLSLSSHPPTHTHPPGVELVVDGAGGHHARQVGAEHQIQRRILVRGAARTPSSRFARAAPPARGAGAGGSAGGSCAACPKGGQGGGQAAILSKPALAGQGPEQAQVQEEQGGRQLARQEGGLWQEGEVDRPLVGEDLCRSSRGRGARRREGLRAGLSRTGRPGTFPTRVNHSRVQLC